MIISSPRKFAASILIACAAWCIVLFAGCLTVESKEYHIRLRSDHSGEATIKFINILSETDDTVDVEKADFQQLVEFYLHGSQIEKDNPGFHNLKKRMYEEDGALVGEITLTFDSLSSLRIFKFDKESPFMYFVGSPLSSEQFVESNGVYGRDWMPIVFWPKDTRDLYLKTKVVSEVSHHRSLLKNFKEWQAGKDSLQPSRTQYHGAMKSNSGAQARMKKQ